MHEETLNLKELFAIIIKRKLLIIGMIFLATVFGLVNAYSRPISFEAEATLRLTPKPIESPYYPLDEGFTRQTILTYVEIVKSRTVAQVLVDKIEADNARKISLENIRRNITVQPIKDTELIKINVKAATPQDAQYFVNTLADILVKHQGEPRFSEVFQSYVEFRMIDPAVKPTTPLGQSKKLSIAIAAVFGLFAGTGLALVMEYRNRNRKNNIA